MYRIYANAVPFFMRLEHPFIWVFTEFLILVPLGYWRMTAYRQIKSLSSIYIEIYLCHIWEREKDRDKEKQRDNWEQYLFLLILISIFMSYFLIAWFWLRTIRREDWGAWTEFELWIKNFPVESELMSVFQDKGLVFGKHREMQVF